MSGASKNSLLFIFITVLIDVIGLGIIIPVIPTLIQELTGDGISEAASDGGWLMLSYGLMQFIFAPILGEFSDRFGRKKVLLLGLLGLGLDFIVHAVAPTLFWLFIGRILAGICGSSFSVANAYIADVSKPEEKAKNFGLVGAAFGVGFIVGPLIGGVAGDIWGSRAPFWIAAGLTFLNFLFGLLVLPESLPKSRRRAIDFKNFIPGRSLLSLAKYKAFLGLMLALFLAYFAGQTLPATWSYYTMLRFGWDEGDVGISLAVVGVCAAITQAILLGRLVKKFGDKRVILGGFVLWSLGMVLYAFAPNGFLMYCFIAPYVLGGVATPTIQSYISNRVPGNEQGNLQGALTSMISITSFAGPLLASQMFSAFSDEEGLYFPGAPYMAGAVLFAISLAAAWWSLSRPNQPEIVRESG